MRLLVNAVGARIGGAARHLPPFLRALRDAEPEWRIHLAVSAGEGWLAEGVPLRGVVEVPLSFVQGRPVWDLVGLCQLAERLRADAILNLTNHGPLRRCFPSIVYQRNPIYFDPVWVRTLKRSEQNKAAARRLLAFRQMAMADAVVTPTKTMADFLRAWPRAPKDIRYEVVPHAVDCHRFAYEPRPLASLDAIHIAVISHAAPHKGIDTAVALIGELTGEGHNATLSLTIPREGHTGIFRAYVDRCAALAEKLAVADRVQFLGATDDVERLYRSADVILVPSLTESFGFPLVEAMASGTPVLASDIPSSVEVAGDAVWYYRAGDECAAMEGLTAMAKEFPDDAGQRLDRGRDRAEQLSWDRNARAVAELIRRYAR